MIPATDVTISDPKKRAAGTKRAPYRVRIYVRGKEVKSKNFEKKALADQYATRLKAAKLNGEAWDEVTGEPTSWRRSSLTIAQWVKELVDRDRIRLEPASLDSRVEVFARALVLLTSSKANRPNESALRAETRDWLYGQQPCMPRYLANASLELTSIDTKTWSTFETKLTTKEDGTAMAAATTRRYIGISRSAILEAVDARIIGEVLWPLRRTRKSNLEKVSNVVAEYEIPTLDWARRCIDRLITHQPGSQNYKVLASLTLYTGMRPGEARALHVEDLHLPANDDEWGEVNISKADKRSRLGAMGTHQQIGTTKTGRSRTVPVPPVLVALLRHQVGSRTTGLLCSTPAGRMISESNMARAWTRARGDESYTLYSLRHLYATLLIMNGLQAGEVADLMGNSVEVLLSVYTHWFRADKTMTQLRIQAAFA